MSKPNTLFISDQSLISVQSTLVEPVKTHFVSNQTEFNSVLASEFTYSQVVIQVELKWSASRAAFHGYELAKQLFNHSNRTTHFSLVFLSMIPQSVLFKINKNSNRIFSQVFPHIDLLLQSSTIQFPLMSENKFKYLKNYCMVKTGILDRLEHNLRNTTPANIKSFADDMSANQDLLSPVAIQLMASLTNESDDRSFLNAKAELQNELLRLKFSFASGSERGSFQSHSKVLLIEDDQQIAEQIVNQLQPYFRNPITPCYGGTKAIEELSRSGIEYDVVVTDMELLQENLYDPVQGIDILDYCTENFPHLVTRVITSLPKNALAQLLKKDFNEIIFKSGSVEKPIPVYERLDEIVLAIDTEAKKRRALRKTTGPVNSWWGKCLTRQLYLLKVFEPTSYAKIWDNVTKQADKFSEDLFIESDKKVDTNFKEIKSIGTHPEGGWEIIETLLLHRLIALYFAQQSGWQIHYNDYKDNANFNTGLGPSKQYFSTILGIHGENLDYKDEQPIVIHQKNLFPEEVKWLKSKLESVTNPNANLYNFNEDVYNLIEKLHDLFPHVFKSKPTPETLKIEDGFTFLQLIIESYQEERFDKLRNKTLKSVIKSYVPDLKKLPDYFKLVIGQLIEAAG